MGVVVVLVVMVMQMFVVVWMLMDMLVGVGMTVFAARNMVVVKVHGNLSLFSSASSASINRFVTWMEVGFLRKLLGHPCTSPGASSATQCIVST